MQKLLDERDGRKVVASRHRRQVHGEPVVLLDHQGVLAMADAADNIFDGMKPELEAVVQQRDGDGDRLR